MSDADPPPRRVLPPTAPPRPETSADRLPARLRTRPARVCTAVVIAIGVGLLIWQLSAPPHHLGFWWVVGYMLSFSGVLALVISRKDRYRS